MDVIKTDIDGLVLIKPKLIADKRGAFYKTFHDDVFRENNLNTDWKEEYFSKSNKNVLRGMHFQLPPEDHFKLVSCTQGKVLDVVLDIRTKSLTYKRVSYFELNGSNAYQLYIPKGCAHGFLALENNSTMFYKVSTVYSPEEDAGILWNSIDFDWPCLNPIVSDRDLNHLPLEEFNSPF